MTDEVMQEITQALSADRFSSYRQFKKFCDILSLCTDQLNSKILYFIYLSRFSSNYGIQVALNESSRSKISHRSAYLVNSGLLDFKRPSEEDFELYQEFWKDSHPRTWGSGPYYISTDLNDKLMDSIGVYIRSILLDTTVITAMQHGKTFKRFYDTQIQKQREKEEQKRQMALNSKGACNRCSCNITEDSSYEFFYGSIYCTICINEMKKKGELAALVKKSNR